MEPNPLDTQVLSDLLASTGGDPDFVTELIQTYFADSGQLLVDLRTYLASGQASEFRRAAHSFKSNSASFGARRLAALCKELEDLGKSGVLDAASPILEQVEVEYPRVRAALEGWPVLS